MDGFSMSSYFRKLSWIVFFNVQLNSETLISQWHVIKNIVHVWSTNIIHRIFLYELNTSYKDIKETLNSRINNKIRFKSQNEILCICKNFQVDRKRKNLMRRLLSDLHPPRKFSVWQQQARPAWLYPMINWFVLLVL